MLVQLRAETRAPRSRSPAWSISTCLAASADTKTYPDWLSAADDPCPSNPQQHGVVRREIEASLCQEGVWGRVEAAPWARA